MRRVAEFVNADVIQKEKGVSEIAAGRITLNRLNGARRGRQGHGLRDHARQPPSPPAHPVDAGFTPPADVPWVAEDIIDAVNRAVTAALKRHKARGESVVTWRDGKIVTLKPEEIEI